MALPFGSGRLRALCTSCYQARSTRCVLLGLCFFNLCLSFHICNAKGGVNALGVFVMGGQWN